MTVHILGCGPAGLAAALAADIAGEDIRIFSNPRKSHMFGAQYLHKPLPLVNSLNGGVIVKYQLQGSIVQYREKVYGPVYDGTVSPDELEEEHAAWDIRYAYDRLWMRYGPYVEKVENINPRWMNENRNLRPMISSVQLPSICYHPGICVFRSTAIWAAGEAPERGIRFGHPYLFPENTVVCNGLPQPEWYRASRIFGHSTVEWPWGAGPNAMAPAAVTKPIGNNCECWPDVRKVGRYGKWEKGVLVHHAYEETAQWLASQ